MDAVAHCGQALFCFWISKGGVSAEECYTLTVTTIAGTTQHASSLASSIAWVRFLMETWQNYKRTVYHVIHVLHICVYIWVFRERIDRKSVV